MKSVVEFSVFIFLILSHLAAAQVQVSKSVIMTAGSETNRQIKLLGTASNEDQALNAESFIFNSCRYAVAHSADSIYFDLNPPLTSYVPGTTVFFKTISANTGSVTLNINQLGPVPLKKSAANDLLPGDLKPNIISAAVFDGTNFQLITNDALICPAGFVKVNSKYCIEINERTASNFFAASVTCNDLNYRLCNWGEWYFACQRSGLGLQGMINNYEWTNDAGNGNNGVRVAGNGTCTAAGVLVAETNSQPFRCCFSK